MTIKMQINYDYASPEMLEDLERIRDIAFENYQGLKQECESLRTVLGLDNPEFLTRLETRILYELDEAEPNYTQEYSANQPAHEAELKELALEVARFEAEGNVNANHN